MMAPIGRTDDLLLSAWLGSFRTMGVRPPVLRHVLEHLLDGVRRRGVEQDRRAAVPLDALLAARAERFGEPHVPPSAARNGLQNRYLGRDVRTNGDGLVHRWRLGRRHHRGVLRRGLSHQILFL